MKKLFLLVLLVLSTISFAQVITIKHTAYEIHFDTILKEPVYTVYTINKSMLSKVGDRTSFRFDPLLKKSLQGTGFGSFDSKFGYDRGHLAPDVDFRSNIKTQAEAMYYDNTAVQNSHCNRGIWKSLESYVDNVALLYEVKVTTGCIYNNSTTKFNGLVVPTYYWKILEYNGKVEAFKVPNKAPKPGDSFQNYKVDPSELLKLIN